MKDPRLLYRIGICCLSGLMLTGLPQKASARLTPETSAHRSTKAWPLAEKKSISKKAWIRVSHINGKPALYIRYRAAGNQPLQLYLFDLDGRCVHQSAVEQEQTVPLKTIESGNYLFELFNDDVRVDNGQVHLK